MSRIELLRKLRGRSAREWWLLLRAAAALAVMRLAVGLLPFGTIARLLRLREDQAAQPISSSLEDRAARTGRAVRSVAAHTPWHSTCLVQALAAAALLRHQSPGATLSLGVARDPALRDRLDAHAWLRCGELIVIGQAERDRFIELTTFVAY